MRTYKAELAPWRMRPLHPDYVEACKRHAEKLQKPGPRRHAFETLCPYCGTDGKLVGTIQVGAKGRRTGISMTRDGYDVPDARDRDLEILIIHCKAKDCGAAIDPLAYLSPAVFYAEMTNESLFPDP